MAKIELSKDELQCIRLKIYENIDDHKLDLCKSEDWQERRDSQYKAMMRFINQIKEDEGEDTIPSFSVLIKITKYLEKEDKIQQLEFEIKKLKSELEDK